MIFSKGYRGFFVFILCFVLGSKLFEAFNYYIRRKTYEEYNKYIDIIEVADLYHKRFFALIIDLFFGLIYFLIINGIAENSNFQRSFERFEQGFLVLICLSVIFIQEVVFYKTIGKKIFGVVIVNEQFEKPTALQILIRNIIKVTLFFDITRLICFIVFAFDKENRFLNDIVAKTKIVKK